MMRACARVASSQSLRTFSPPTGPLCILLPLVSRVHARPPPPARTRQATRSFRGRCRRPAASQQHPVKLLVLSNRERERERERERRTSGSGYSDGSVFYSTKQTTTAKNIKKHKLKLQKKQKKTCFCACHSGHNDHRHERVSEPCLLFPTL